MKKMNWNVVFKGTNWKEKVQKPTWQRSVAMSPFPWSHRTFSMGEGFTFFQTFKHYWKLTGILINFDLVIFYISLLELSSVFTPRKTFIRRKLSLITMHCNNEVIIFIFISNKNHLLFIFVNNLFKLALVSPTAC